MALTQVKTTGIADDAVTQDKVANDAIDISEIKAGSDGELISFDASGNPVKIAAGTSGHFLKSQGDASQPVFAAIPAGVGGATGVDFNDDVKARFGTGNDLEIYHDGSNSYINEAGTGDLYIRGGVSVRITDLSDNKMFLGQDGGEAQLYYDGLEKLATKTGGVTITGNLEPEADNTRDLGSSTKRWANVYVGDMQLSNEGAANDVDGTWGSYTLQEGADDLFLINNRTGKKYKFKIAEVN